MAQQPRMKMYKTSAPSRPVKHHLPGFAYQGKGVFLATKKSQSAQKAMLAAHEDKLDTLAQEIADIKSMIESIKDLIKGK